jgi:signal transduction histidine kinase
MVSLFSKFKLAYALSLLICYVNISCNNLNNEQPNKTQNSPTVIDSINFYIQKSQNRSISLTKRSDYLSISYEYSKSLKLDTFQTRKLSAIAYKTLKLKDTSLFKQRNKEALYLSQKIKDTFAIGDVQWNYASYYNNLNIYDSAYYHFSLANREFNKSGDLYEDATTEYGMAFIKGRFNDYSGSEILTYNAIKKFERLDDYRSLYSCYNHLAALQNDILEYDRSLFYNEKAIEYLNKFQNNQNLYEQSFNNLGLTYLYKNEFYKALTYFDKVLRNDSLKIKNINRYARVIDNKTYTRLKIGNKKNILSKLTEAYNIRDSLNNSEGKIISLLHLSEYYSSQKNNSKALIYARNAMKLSNKINNGNNYLKSLKLLSKIDPDNNQTYLKDYIEFNDSLLIVERQTQNKFTRIDYETDQYIEETERLSQLNIVILIVSIGSFIFVSLIYFINLQRKRNRNLYLESEQQKANEQVYILALNQKEKLEKEKNNERIRISEELHDGILGKLFGTRLNLSFLDMNLNESVKSKYDSFLLELQDIEKEIREVSHKLNTEFDDSKINFITLVQQLIDKNSEIGNFNGELIGNNEINWDNIDEITKVNLYKIIQESIFNIIKHSEADNVMIKFRFLNDHLNLSIIDDGVGFKEKRKPEGIGLKIIKSRIEKLDGSYEIISGKGEGTKILIYIPIK